MSYVGYIPLIKQFVFDRFISEQRPDKQASPTILEIGIDKGTTLIPLVVFLTRTCPNFTFVGVDVLVQEHVGLVLANLDMSSGQNAFCIQGNSLNVMPRLVEQDMKFDVVLIDGDHNYYTVSKELGYVEKLVHNHSVIICDDYNGRWAEKDLWYAERETHKDVKIATPRVETDKRGVKAAVDEWLDTHPEWHKEQPVKGEPIALVRKVI